MPNFSPYPAVIAAIVVSIVAVLFLHTTVPPHVAAPATRATSSTLAVVPSISFPSLSPPDLRLSSSQAEPSSIRRGVPRPTPFSSAPSATTSPPKSTLQATSSPTLTTPLQNAAVALRKALVNIICAASTGSRGKRIISGGGVFIDTKGVILTNAHIGGYFLLAGHDVSCVIRSGGPAVSRYRAALIFISPAWLRANPDIFVETTPTGTGEYDFALLAVTKSATTTPLPTSFPSLPLGNSTTKVGTPVAIASYGAQLLNKQQLESALFPTVVFGSVKEVLTFAADTVDVLAFGGSAAAQEGSSGGGVTDASGELIGTITTSTVEGDVVSRTLTAITAPYVRAEYAHETGRTLDSLLAEPTASSVANFAPQIPALREILTTNLR